MCVQPLIHTPAHKYVVRAHFHPQPHIHTNRTAVSDAGGLGIITALTQPTPADLRKEIQKCRTMTDKPFGVNFTIIPSFKNFDFDGFANVCYNGDLSFTNGLSDVKQ